jgi:transcriptional repressor NrdR
VDSRPAEEGFTIRRRRECLACGKRYTTYERVEEVPLRVVKKDGTRVPFDR